MFLKCLKKTRSNSHEMWQYVLQVLRLIFFFIWALRGSQGPPPQPPQIHFQFQRVLGVLINWFLLGRGGGVIIRIVKKAVWKLTDKIWLGRYIVSLSSKCIFLLSPLASTLSGYWNYNALLGRITSDSYHRKWSKGQLISWGEAITWCFFVDWWMGV